MSLELGDSELSQVELELESLSELSMKINDCQNRMRRIQIELKDNFERDRKILLDLRLKFGKKIEEAKYYYNALSDFESEKEKEDQLQAQLIENQENLNIMLSEISPDIAGVKCNQIKYLREKINQMKLSGHLLSVQCLSKADKVLKLKNKYNRSIDLTKQYFITKSKSNEAGNQLIHLLNTCQDEMVQYKSQYSAHMTNLENISSKIHLQRETQNLINSRLIEPMPECDYGTIPSYDLDGNINLLRKIRADDERCDSGYSNSDFRDSTTLQSLPNHLSRSQNRLYESVSECDSSALPSPCKSINIPPGYSTGIIVGKSTNITWHPLL